jgi:tRNA-splicing endonuclease subunit Sen54
MHFTAMGHSAPMPLPIESQRGKLQKTLALLPEEAIYLIERGALFCRKEIRRSMEDVKGFPMSVQQSYSEMIGTENLTLEKYQVRSICAYCRT